MAFCSAVALGVVVGLSAHELGADYVVAMIAAGLGAAGAMAWYVVWLIR
jgi:hypothetical protein